MTFQMMLYFFALSTLEIAKRVDLDSMTNISFVRAGSYILNLYASLGSGPISVN